VKVLFLTNLWPEEGRPWYGAFVRTQAESLRDLGVDVDVLRIRGHDSRGAYLSAAASAIGLNWRGGYDVVHSHYGHSGVVARLQARAPLVVSYCGDDLLGTRRPDGSVAARSRVEAAVFRRLAHVAAATITKSQEMENALPPRCRTRNHVIPNGVDLRRFRPIPRDEARRRLGWEAGERTVLFVGSTESGVKNYPLAEEACRQLAERVPDIRLRVAWGVEADAVPVHMSAADALIFTSTSEGSPNVIKEAMASELPIVATPVGDVPERLRDVPGCFVTEPQAPALADALAEAVTLGRAPEARAAVAELSLERVASRVVDVYESALRRRRSPAPPVTATPGAG
jgi:teichuronic acid biosynthesis glycosyltransferase TuaC